MSGCSHYSEPFEPYLPGYDAFPGLKMHAHHFRDASDLNEVGNLAVVGAGPSGVDLAAELCDKVRQVLFKSACIARRSQSHVDAVRRLQMRRWLILDFPCPPRIVESQPQLLKS